MTILLVEDALAGHSVLYVDSVAGVYDGQTRVLESETVLVRAVKDDPLRLQVLRGHAGTTSVDHDSGVEVETPATSGDLTSQQIAAITGATFPTAENYFATISELNGYLADGILDGLNNSAGPTAENPYATMRDVTDGDDATNHPSDVLTSDEVDALTGPNTPSAANIFMTAADVETAISNDVMDVLTKIAYIDPADESFATDLIAAMIAAGHMDPAP